MDFISIVYTGSYLVTADANSDCGFLQIDNEQWAKYVYNEVISVSCDIMYKAIQQKKSWKLKFHNF